MTSLLALVFAMAAGLLLSRVVKLLHLPNVTGYLVAGLLIGPSCLGLIGSASLESLSLITTVALGFIAFSIGGEFKLEHLRQLGAQIFIITLLQAAAAVLFVMLGVWTVSIINPAWASLPMALLLGAIASATAPAATLMVVRQYKAHGPVTDALLPVVAFDDAVGLMIFSVCFAIARVFAAGEALTLQSTLLEPLREIGLSLVVGSALGILLSLSMRFFKSRANRLCLMLVAVLAGVTLSDMLALSSLLTCMMIGALFANLRPDSPTILEGCERWTPPVFMLFFVISGAELDLSILPTVGIVGVVYLVLRSLGKYLGAYWGATLAHAPATVRKYLGITLLPQAGVAIGMAQMVAAMPGLGSLATKVVTVTLSATLIYELIGPVLTKIALAKAGEITK